MIFNDVRAGRLSFAPAALVGLALCTSVLPALGQSFSYSDTDLLLGFRKAGGATTVLVNLGPAAQFYNAKPGSTFSVGNPASLFIASSTAFGGLSSYAGLQYSVAGTLRSAANANADHPVQTLWVTKESPDLNTASDPWTRQSSFGLGNTAAKIQTMGNLAVSYASVNVASIDSNTVLIPSADGDSYSRWVGSGTSGNGAVGNFNNTFQGNVEGKTPAVFSNGDAVRLDLYQVTPGSGDAQNLGYFRLTGSGALTFTATSVPEPGTWALVGLGVFALVGASRRNGGAR
jgi:hypothetical protein